MPRPWAQAPPLPAGPAGGAGPGAPGAAREALERLVGPSAAPGPAPPALECLGDSELGCLYCARPGLPQVGRALAELLRAPGPRGRAAVGALTEARAVHRLDAGLRSPHPPTAAAAVGVLAALLAAPGGPAALRAARSRGPGGGGGGGRAAWEDDYDYVSEAFPHPTTRPQLPPRLPEGGALTFVHAGSVAPPAAAQQCDAGRLGELVLGEGGPPEVWLAAVRGLAAACEAEAGAAAVRGWAASGQGDREGGSVDGDREDSRARRLGQRVLAELRGGPSSDYDVLSASADLLEAMVRWRLPAVDRGLAAELAALAAAAGEEAGGPEALVHAAEVVCTLARAAGGLRFLRDGAPDAGGLVVRCLRAAADPAGAAAGGLADDLVSRACDVAGLLSASPEGWEALRGRAGPDFVPRGLAGPQGLGGAFGAADLQARRPWLRLFGVLRVAHAAPAERAAWAALYRRLAAAACARFGEGGAAAAGEAEASGVAREEHREPPGPGGDDGPGREGPEGTGMGPREAAVVLFALVQNARFLHGQAGPAAGVPELLARLAAAPGQEAATLAAKAEAALRLVRADDGGAGSSSMDWRAGPGAGDYEEEEEEEEDAGALETLRAVLDEHGPDPVAALELDCY